MTPREEWQLPTRRLGRRVLLFERVDSTNAQAAALADDSAHDGLVLLAEEQTAGRGQYGRSWTCPPGQGVLLSVLLFPPAALRRPVLLAAWAADAVSETIRACTGLEAQIKWPNDVLLAGRKVCGILIESKARGRDTDPTSPGWAVVVGIGLNVNQTPEAFAEAALPEAGSLALFHRQPLDRAQVARQLIAQLDLEYDQLCRGELAPLEARWRQRLGLLGKPVLVEGPEKTYRGRLRTLTWDGLEVELAPEHVLRLRPELVKHVRAD